ncbi:MAG: hypothetical protein WAM28_07950 [Chlamydiales bacterium]
MVPKEGLSVLEAVENLNALVEADSLSEIEVTEEGRLISHRGEIQGEIREIYWMRASVDDQTLEVIRETFKSLLTYLKRFYSTHVKRGQREQLLEGMNTIMILVDEASEKLERFGRLFRERVNGIEEYRNLQDFYHNTVIKESYREFAKRPLPQKKKEATEDQYLEEELQYLLEEKEELEEVGGAHILNDLEVIKRDHIYELFHLKNEAGHTFYTYALARNIKLSCDFGEYAKEYFGDDPLLQIKNWEDKDLHLFAQKILKSCKPRIEKFYKEAMKYKGVDLAISMHNAMMALMLAANPRNLIRQFAPKGCHFYFFDFLMFLRESVNSMEYQKLLLHSRPLPNRFFQSLLDLVDAVCYALFTERSDQIELQEALKQLIERIKPKKRKTLSEKLAGANDALTEALKKHPNGPVFKAFDIIREEEFSFFDPILLGNVPNLEGLLKFKEKELKLIRMPCPIWQEWINKAHITEEFKAFLRALKKEENILIINFQDRTSWKEHARSVAIEELANQAEFSDRLTVVTLSKDTDFYNQSGIYHNLDEAQAFIDHFREHLGDESTGYYFPGWIKQDLFPNFISQLLDQVHKTFFENKKRLLFLERLDFIQLVYHFIELKLIELVNPSFLVLLSKDSLDIGGTSTVGLMALLATDHKHEWSDEEVDRLNTLLFGPTLMHRERVIHPERFDRLIAFIHLLEKKKGYFKEFVRLFQKETLASEVVIKS